MYFLIYILRNGTPEYYKTKKVVIFIDLFSTVLFGIFLAFVVVFFRPANIKSCNATVSVFQYSVSVLVLFPLLFFIAS